MNINELEHQLFELTPSERKYLQHDFLDYSQISTSKKIDGSDIYSFSYEHITQGLEETTQYFVRKQSRFAPIPDHVTDVIELNYVYHGKSTHYINHHKIDLEEGDLIFIDTNTIHSVDSLDYNDIVLSINIKQQFFRDHFLNHFKNPTTLTKFLLQAISDSQNHNQFLLFKNESSQNIKLLFQQLLEEVYNPKILDHIYKDYLLQLILLELIRSFSVESNGTNDKNSHKQQLTLEILAYISQHYATTTLEKCSQKFGYNTSYFSTLVKDCTGQTFKELLQEKRLESSLIPLLHSNLSIKEIAMNVGFSNLNHFYQLFKNKYHQTPAEYRQTKKEK